jgi:hypothetical protein
VKFFETILILILSSLITAVFDGCNRNETDRKLFHFERRFEGRIESLRSRRDEGGRDDFRPFRPGAPGPNGAGPIGAGPAAAAPEPAATSATGNEHVTLKVESEL